MKILLTGSNGFVGKNLSEFLKKRFEKVHEPKRKTLELTDTKAVDKYLSQNSFDIIIHCCVTFLSVEQNLKMYFNLEKNSLNYGKLICIGSGAEYDPKHYYPMMTEDFFGKYIPDSSDIYSYSKFKIADDIEKKNKNIFNLRVFGIYGKYEDYNRRFISNNICRFLSGKNIVVNQNSIFDYLYVDDFCNLLLRFMNSEPKKKSYNLCSSLPIELIELAKIIKEITSCDTDIEVKNSNIKTNYTGSNKLFINEFGKYDFTNHRNSIQNLFNWYKFQSNIDFKKINFT